MTNEEFSEKAKEIFLYVERSNNKEGDQWYFEALDTFLAFSSFSLNDGRLFPYWSDCIDCNSIIYIAPGIKSYSLLCVERMFIREIICIYLEEREKVWEFTDRFDFSKKNLLIEMSLSRIEKIFITGQSRFNTNPETNPEKFIDKFDEYIYSLSSCNAYFEYIVSKYKRE